jgi:hypothetical protein
MSCDPIAASSLQQSAHERLMERGRGGVGEDLIDTSSGHHIPTQEKRESLTAGHAVLGPSSTRIRNPNNVAALAGVAGCRPRHAAPPPRESDDAGAEGGPSEVLIALHAAEVGIWEFV